MSNPVNLVMPMGGAGSRFRQEGENTPKPLLLLKGKPFFYWSVQSLIKFVTVKKLIFVVLREHITYFQIDKKIASVYPAAIFVVLDRVLNGPVFTCREGAKYIDNELPVIFNDCDHMFYAPELYNYCSKESSTEIDGLLLTFKASSSRFSYVAYNAAGFVEKTVEKQVISGDAICGAYFFRNRQTFLSASDMYLHNSNSDEYFMSGVYNSLISSGGKVKTVCSDAHLSFGTPEEYETAQSANIYNIVN